MIVHFKISFRSFSFLSSSQSVIPAYDGDGATI